VISRKWHPWMPVCLATATLLALFLWIVSKTEWVEQTVPRLPTGEAASDELYALKKVLHGIGASVVSRDDLAQLPPSGATLLLSGWAWGLLPDRNAALRAWVEQGGHLVIEARELGSSATGGADWIPIQIVRPKPSKASREAPVAPRSDQAGPVLVIPRSSEKECRHVAEPEGVPAAYLPKGVDERATEGFTLCIYGGLPLETRQTVLWGLAGEDGSEVLRVGFGAGSVTAVRSSWDSSAYGVFANGRILKGDNALVAVAALQARSGAEVWLVSGLSGQPLLAWLWSRARVVVVLGLLALALWLWRATARFGPVEASLPLARRSITEQISGTAVFLSRRRPEVLHAAQVRALDEAAAGRVRNYARLDRVDRAAAIAAATGLAPAALERALNPGAIRAMSSLVRALILLETARRKLLEPGPTPTHPLSRRTSGVSTHEDRP
jgi:hypothetical protein